MLPLRAGNDVGAGEQEGNMRTSDEERLAQGPGRGGLRTGKPTVAGDVPAELEGCFAAGPGVQAEFLRLPPPRGRCPLTGCSRSWVLEHGEAGDFRLVRIRKPGRQRGVTLIDLASYRGFLNRLRDEAEGGGQ